MPTRLVVTKLTRYWRREADDPTAVKPCFAREYRAGHVQRCDTLDAATTARICADGSFVAEVRGARVGVQPYLPDEAGAPKDFKGSVVRAYRPENEVFSRNSMAPFAATVFTINNPPSWSTLVIRTPCCYRTRPSITWSAPPTA